MVGDHAEFLGLDGGSVATSTYYTDGTIDARFVIKQRQHRNSVFLGFRRKGGDDPRVRSPDARFSGLLSTRGFAEGVVFPSVAGLENMSHGGLQVEITVRIRLGDGSESPEILARGPDGDFFSCVVPAGRLPAARAAGGYSPAVAFSGSARGSVQLVCVDIVQEASEGADSSDSTIANASDKALVMMTQAAASFDDATVERSGFGFLRLTGSN